MQIHPQQPEHTSPLSYTTSYGHNTNRIFQNEHALTVQQVRDKNHVCLNEIGGEAGGIRKLYIVCFCFPNRSTALNR